VASMDDILGAVVAAMQGDTALVEIQTYHQVEGMIPGIDPSVSVWIPKPRYKEYTNDLDEVDAEVHIGLCLYDMDPERGESRVRAFAEEIRMLFTADDHTLDGLLDDSFFESWEFASTATEQYELLHLADGIWIVTYYASRARDVEPTDMMDELDFDETIIDPETIGG